MIPAAGPAYLDDMNREFRTRLGETRQLLGGTSGPGCRPELVAVDPGYECQLLFPADGTRNLAPPAVEFGRTQEVGICITYLGDTDPPRVHVGQQ